MNAEQLSRVGEKLVKRCGSRDPFEIARQLGINVEYSVAAKPSVRKNGNHLSG